MARVAAYATLYPFMVPELPGCPSPVMLQALQKAGRQFAVKSEAWREDLFPLPIVDFQRDYLIVSPYAGARVHRIIRMAVNGQVQDPGWWEMYHEDTIRFRTNYAPNNLDDTLLICGVSGTPLVAGWTAITNGGVLVSMDGQSYGLTGLDFSVAADMDGVALVIQTAMRKSITSNTGYCWWSGTRFGLWVESGLTSYLAAAGTGTDLSGPTYLNGLTGTGKVSPRMDLRIVYRPDIVTDVLPAWFHDRFAECITALAMSDLMAMTKKSWSNSARASYYRGEYFRLLNTAMLDNLSEFANVSPTPEA